MIRPRGQPPKKKSEKKRHATVYVSEIEREQIEKARQKTNERFAEFVRNSALKRAEMININEN